MRLSRYVPSLTVALSLGLLLPALPAQATSAALARSDTGQTRHIGYSRWDSAADFAAGRSQGVRVAHGKLRIDVPAGSRTYADPAGGRTRAYDFGRWTSPWVASQFGLTELVASWKATTPRDSWVQVEVRGVSEGGTRSSWDTLARWSAGDAAFRRTSLGSQGDDLARVATDTWEANYGGFRSWQLRVTLNRRAGTTAVPRVDTIGAMTSALPLQSSVRTSATTMKRDVLLDVPAYSQMTHTGEYPQYGGGGEAWCSPTSTTMVLDYFDALPAPATYAWVNPRYRDRVVAHSARMTYDYGYRGTGNWPFNTAYAATRTDSAFVTRLRSLREAERIVRAGIPVIASITFGRGELTGAPISASNGHLLVIVGFTSTGDVVVNDPAARSNGTVRRTYDRGQFEDAWLKRHPSGNGMRGSGGLVYLIHDDAHPLPPAPVNANW